MRTTDEIAKQVSYWTKTPPSELGLKVAALLEEWDGLHHFEDSLMRKVEWSHPYYVSVKYRSDLSSWDFNRLTTLVFLAHDLCVRVEISACNPQYLKIMFHARKREGCMATRHPTLEQAVADWRERHPIKEPIV